MSPTHQLAEKAAPPIAPFTDAWLRWDAAALAQACEAAGPAASTALPDQAYWRAMADFMVGGADALAWLDRAWCGFAAMGAGPQSPQGGLGGLGVHGQQQAAVTAHAALVLCLLDAGAMSRLEEWHARVEPGPQPVEGGKALPALSVHTDSSAPSAPSASSGQPAQPAQSAPGAHSALWLRLGALARVALGKPDGEAASQAADSLLSDLQPLQTLLSPHERLLVALVLVEYHFAVSRFELIDYLSNLVEHPALFDAAAPALQARWVHTHGLALYHVGNHERAEKAWQRALVLSQAAGPGSAVRLQATLALARLLLDRGRVDEADRVVEALDPRWGAGRTLQLVDLQQVRARVQLLRGQPARALATLDEAERLAAAAGVKQTENGGRLTDRAQIFMALDRLEEAQAVFARMAAVQSGREGQVATALQHLLCAWVKRTVDPVASHQELVQGLALAQESRYTMFFRLLPDTAASVCALALQFDVAPQFVMEVIRARQLPAPLNADGRWPWPLWLKLLGGFEMRRDGALEPGSAKTQQKPLELLRLLACERNLSLGTQAVIEALWPDADDAAARKSLEMAVLRLRRLLGDATLLWVNDGRVGLDGARASSDVQQRRRLIEQIEALAMRASGGDASPVDPNGASGLNRRGGSIAPSTPSECMALVERVIQFSRGELLAGMPPVPWLEAERQRYRNDTVRAALASASVMERLQVGPPERELLEAALRIEPLAESLVRRLMHAHERAGQRGDALRVFESYRQQMQARGTQPGAPIDAQWRALLGQPRSAVP